MVGPISDTGELLRGAGASARESYYKRSASRYVVYAIAVVLLLAIAIIGIMQGDFLGYVLAAAGAFGLAIVAIWLSMR